MAGDPVLAPLLLGLGVDELSAAPPLVPAVKYIIRRLKLSEAKELADFALQMRIGRRNPCPLPGTGPADRPQPVRDQVRILLLAPIRPQAVIYCYVARGFCPSSPAHRVFAARWRLPAGPADGQGA